MCKYWRVVYAREFSLFGDERQRSMHTTCRLAFTYTRAGYYRREDGKSHRRFSDEEFRLGLLIASQRDCIDAYLARMQGQIGLGLRCEYRIVRVFMLLCERASKHLNINMTFY